MNQLPQQGLPKTLVGMYHAQVAVMPRQPTYDDEVVHDMEPALAAVGDVVESRLVHVASADAAARAIALDDRSPHLQRNGGLSLTL